jgi:hypothetical protein
MGRQALSFAPPRTLDESEEGLTRGWPRLLSRKLAATYCSVSEKEIDRLIGSGELGIVRLPAKRHANGVGIPGTNRRVLIDRAELDALIARSREHTR